eukprot:3133000-Amphidinium_carterae.1
MTMSSEEWTMRLGTADGNLKEPSSTFRRGSLKLLFWRRKLATRSESPAIEDSTIAKSSTQIQ